MRAGIAAILCTCVLELLHPEPSVLPAQNVVGPRFKLFSCSWFPVLPAPRCAEALWWRTEPGHHLGPPGGCAVCRNPLGASSMGLRAASPQKLGEALSRPTGEGGPRNHFPKLSCSKLIKRRGVEQCLVPVRFSSGGRMGAAGRRKDTRQSRKQGAPQNSLC